MHILGISAMGHDPAAALVSENGIVAIEDGKLSRARSQEGIPRHAIHYCISTAKVGWKELELVAVASRPGRAWLRDAFLRARLALLSPVRSAYFVNKAAGELGRELNNFRILRELAGGPPARVEAFDHQLCHVSSSYFASPCDRALLLSLDEHGDALAGLVAMGEGSSIRELSKVPLPHSLGWLFTKITALLGFQSHSDEHKTQWLGLSAEPALVDAFLAMLRRHPQGPPHLNAKYFHRSFAGELPFTDEFYRALGITLSGEPRVPQIPGSLRTVIAASLQKACGVALGDWLESLRKQTGQKALCLAGGLFLNPLLVSAVEQNTAFDLVFVQPAAGNEGTALGAAWLAWHRRGKNHRVAPLSTLYWGPSYSNEEIKQVLDNCKAAYRWCDSEDQKIEATVQLLQAGKIVAWFQGHAEFGPRALGNRSLLASPWSPYVKENLNDFVKHRESFRPFALAVPEEDSADYFHCSANAHFMATMAVAKDKARELFADSGSAFISQHGWVRLHVVARNVNPLLWKLLKRCGQNAPAPMLVNTSFNLFGEPLVISPRDAVRSYYCSGTDALVAGSFLLTKR
jgi:carbamoyltransferase